MFSNSYHDPIEFLVNRKYPDFPFLTVLKKQGKEINPEQKERYTKADAYQKVLRSKTTEEIAELYKNEQRKWFSEMELKNEMALQRLLEARADYGIWSKVAYWTLDEAISLSFGLNPNIVNWETIKSHINTSPFAKKYEEIRFLAYRAKIAQQLGDPTLPESFIVWAKDNEIEFPEELEEKIIARGGNTESWKTRYKELFEKYKKRTEEYEELLNLNISSNKEIEDLRNQLNEIKERDKRKEINKQPNNTSGVTRSRNVARICFAAVCIDKFNWDEDPSAVGKIRTRILNNVMNGKVKGDDETIRGYLEKGREDIKKIRLLYEGEEISDQEILELLLEGSKDFKNRLWTYQLKNTF